MHLTQLNQIFNIVYGNQLDLNKMELDLEGGINFVSRSRENLGVKAKIKKIDIEPFPAGCITVTLGGAYLLSSFIQEAPFYTAQNIKVLTPKQKMSFAEKLYYCRCIEENRVRYVSHGREANRTLDFLLVPSKENIPPWVCKTKTPKIKKESLINKKLGLNTKSWQPFYLKNLFKIYSSKDPLVNTLKEGRTPYIASTEYNNGIIGNVDMRPTNKGNVLTVNRGGSVGETFYQPTDFLATPVDVRLLKPKFKINKYIGLFFTVIIRKEKYRFSYSRKMGTDRLNNLEIKLPVDKDGQPNWQFMEDYIKSLPYSSNL